MRYVSFLKLLFVPFIFTGGNRNQKNESRSIFYRLLFLDYYHFPSVAFIMGNYASNRLVFEDLHLNPYQYTADDGNSEINGRTCNNALLNHPPLRMIKDCLENDVVLLRLYAVYGYHYTVVQMARMLLEADVIPTSSAESLGGKAGGKDELSGSHCKVEAPNVDLSVGGASFPRRGKSRIVMSIGKGGIRPPVVATAISPTTHYEDSDGASTCCPTVTAVSLRENSHSTIKGEINRRHSLSDGIQGEDTNKNDGSFESMAGVTAEAAASCVLQRLHPSLHNDVVASTQSYQLQELLAFQQLQRQSQCSLRSPSLRSKKNDTQDEDVKQTPQQISRKTHERDLSHLTRRIPQVASPWSSVMAVSPFLSPSNNALSSNAETQKTGNAGNCEESVDADDDLESRFISLFVQQNDNKSPGRDVTGRAAVTLSMQESLAEENSIATTASAVAVPSKRMQKLMPGKEAAAVEKNSSAASPPRHQQQRAGLRIVRVISEEEARWQKAKLSQAARTAAFDALCRDAAEADQRVVLWNPSPVRSNCDLSPSRSCRHNRYYPAAAAELCSPLSPSRGYYNFPASSGPPQPPFHYSDYDDDDSIACETPFLRTSMSSSTRSKHYQKRRQGTPDDSCASSESSSMEETDADEESFTEDLDASLRHPAHKKAFLGDIRSAIEAHVKATGSHRSSLHQHVAAFQRASALLTHDKKGRQTARERHKKVLHQLFNGVAKAMNQRQTQKDTKDADDDDESIAVDQNSLSHAVELFLRMPSSSDDDDNDKMRNSSCTFDEKTIAYRSQYSLTRMYVWYLSQSLRTKKSRTQQVNCESTSTAPQTSDNTCGKRGNDEERNTGTLDGDDYSAGMGEHGTINSHIRQPNDGVTTSNNVQQKERRSTKRWNRNSADPKRVTVHQGSYGTVSSAIFGIGADGVLRDWHHQGFWGAESSPLPSETSTQAAVEHPSLILQLLQPCQNMVQSFQSDQSAISSVLPTSSSSVPHEVLSQAAIQAAHVLLAAPFSVPLSVVTDSLSVDTLKAWADVESQSSEDEREVCERHCDTSGQNQRRNVRLAQAVRRELQFFRGSQQKQHHPGVSSRSSDTVKDWLNVCVSVDSSEEDDDVLGHQCIHEGSEGARYTCRKDTKDDQRCPAARGDHRPQFHPFTVSNQLLLKRVALSRSLRHFDGTQGFPLLYHRHEINSRSSTPRVVCEYGNNAQPCSLSSRPNYAEPNPDEHMIHANAVCAVVSFPVLSLRPPPDPSHRAADVTAGSEILSSGNKLWSTR